MEVYTSYFGNRAKWPKDFQPIGITRFPPEKLGFQNWAILAPSEDLLKQYKNKEIDEYVFKCKFIEQLNNTVDKNKLLELLEHYSPVILCCYEKPEDF